MGRWVTFIRNGQIDPKKRHESSARHQKWLKNPQKTKIRQAYIRFCQRLNRNSDAFAVPSFARIQKRFIAHVVATIQTV